MVRTNNHFLISWNGLKLKNDLEVKAKLLVSNSKKWHTYTGFHGIVTNSMTYQPVENAEIFITACTKNSHERGPCSKYDSENFEENKIRKVFC